jgi:3-isopropylmalate dehydrogenase
MTKNTYSLAVMGGDGIGPEVTRQALKAIYAAADVFRFEVDQTDYGLGAERHLRDGHIIDDADIAELSKHDAILFGAIGDPRVPPGVLERGLILKLRTRMRQSVNLRPVRLYPGVQSPMRGLTPERCDLVIVRENSEGMYASDGSTLWRGEGRAVALQESVNTWSAVRSVVDFSFRLAQRRRKKLTLCHKTNVLVHAGAIYVDAVEQASAEHPDVEVDYVHVDAMCQHLPLTPERFDVVVTDNLFGDIISDLGATIQGGLGVACSANLNVETNGPSMFEAVHGSAPDIAGRGWANPAAAILSAALGLAWLGEARAALAVEQAVSAVLATLPGLAGPAMRQNTDEVGDLVAAHVRAQVDTGEPAFPGSVMQALHDLRASDG